MNAVVIIIISQFAFECGHLLVFGIHTENIIGNETFIAS